jgi:hypothetical protein
VDTRYQPGGFGWDTIYPRYDFESGVWDTEDSAFRVDLPDGDYEVTCRFRSNGDETHYIDLYANGERVIKRLKVPDEDTTVEESYMVRVTNGTLIQVIHATRGKNSTSWAWNGFLVRRLEE